MLALVMCAALPALAGAHPLRSAAHGIPHGGDGAAHVAAAYVAGSVWTVLAALALAGFGSLAVRRYGKRAALSSLAVLLGLFALESAVHSVHHLSDRDAAARCVVLSASQHVDGASVDLPAVERPAPVHQTVLVDEGERPHRAAQYRLDAGRAPPSPSA